MFFVRVPSVSFFIPKYMQVIRSGNNGSKGIQEIWHSALVWAYSYPKIRPVVKVALDRIQIIFYHTQVIQTGDNWKCCNLKGSLSKILNARSISKQARKSGFFQVYFQYQKKSKTIHRIQRILEPLDHLKLYVLKYMHPSSYFSSPQQRVLPVILEIPVISDNAD